jgi:hypothetical protein
MPTGLLNGFVIFQSILALIYFVVAGVASKQHCFPAFTAKIHLNTES